MVQGTFFLGFPWISQRRDRILRFFSASKSGKFLHILGGFPLGACAMTTKFLDNKICTFKILLSWRFPRKQAFWDDFPLCPQGPAPSKAKICRLAVSDPYWSAQKNSRKRKIHWRKYLKKSSGDGDPCSTFPKHHHLKDHGFIPPANETIPRNSRPQVLWPDPPCTGVCGPSGQKSVSKQVFLGLPKKVAGNTQGPLNAPFLSGLFSMGFSRGKGENGPIQAFGETAH